MNKLKNKTFLVRFLDRDQIVALYQSSDLFLFPSNIECSPIVLFECMASRTPFLTTDVGNAKEIIEWSHSGELLPTTRDKNGYSRADIGQSVKLLEGMYDNPEKRVGMQEAGFNIWQEQFSWEKIAKKYEDFYLKCVRQPTEQSINSNPKKKDLNSSFCILKYRDGIMTVKTSHKKCHHRVKEGARKKCYIRIYRKIKNWFVWLSLP